MADVYKDFIAGKGGAPSAPQVPSFQGLSPQSDYKGWISQGDGTDEYNKVKISLDPTTRGIKIQAPKWYMDSAEFKDQVLPQFQKLKGKELTDTDFTTLANSDMLKQIQQQADDIKTRHDAVQTYKSQFPKASDDDAMVYLRNAAAANANDKDDKTQMVLGVGKDGKQITASVKEVVDTLKGWDDTSRANFIKNHQKIIDDPKASEADKASALGLISFAKNKKLLGASGVTQLNLGLTSFLAQSDKGIVGWLANQPTRIGNGGKTAAEVSREDLKHDPTTALEGVEGAMKVGNIAGDLVTTGADVIATAPIAELGVAKGISAASKIPELARVAEGGNAALEALKTGNAVSKIAAGTIESIPKDIAFGAGHAVNNADYNGPKDFAINTAINALTLGAAKVGGRALGALDTATNGKLMDFSETVGKGLTRGYDKFRDLPGIGKAINFVSGGFVDQAAPLRRAARSAWANNEISSTEYKDVANAIRSAVQRGRGEAQSFMHSTPEFAQVYKTTEAMGPKEIEKAGQYVNAVQQLQYAKTGKYEMSAKKVKELEAFVDEHKSDLFDQYRQQLADYSAKISDFGVENGVLDKDLIEAMRNDPAFAAGYVRLQKATDMDGPVAIPSANRNLKNKTPVQKLKGPATESLDPFLVANDRLMALSELAAQNKVHTKVVQGINDGWIAGRIVQGADDLKLRTTLKSEMANERQTVDELVSKTVTGMEDDLKKMVEDVEDFNGTGRLKIAARVETGVDDMVEEIIKDPKMDTEVKRLMDELGGGKEGSERVAGLAILSRNKQRISEKLEAALQQTALGKEERAQVTQMFEANINDELEREIALRGVSRDPINARFDEIKQLNKDISPNSELSPSNVQAYFDRGTKGYYEVADPDLAAYFNQRRSPAEDGLFARLMTGVSRGFKLGQTGLNPTFLLVNPIRDVQSAVVGTGYNFLNPQIAHRALLESLGKSPQEIDAFMKQFDALIGHGTQVETARQAEDAWRTVRGIGKEVTQGKVKTAVINTVDLRHPGKSLRQVEDIMGASELITRKRVYESSFDAAIKRGLTPEAAQVDALFNAAQATADFLNVGARVQSFVRTVPYLTAAINGKASFARLFMLDPVGVASRLTAGIVAPVMWLTIHNFTDPERAQAYFATPQWERQNNFIIALDANHKIEIPMSQELASLVAPFRERIEAHYGLETNDFGQTMAKFVLSQSPIDMSAFETRDWQGNVDLQGAAQQVASSVAPQLLKTPLELAIGKDLYTGATINPSPDDLVDSGQIKPGQDPTAGDFTYKGGDSKTLRGIANLTGVKQGFLQSAIKNYTGAVGPMILNAVDKMAGAPDTQQGGKSVAEAFASRFFGSSFNQAQSDYYSGIDKLEAAKKSLQNNLDKLARSSYASDDPTGVEAQRQHMIDAYGEKVADFTDKYGSFYQKLGGVKPFQMDAIIKLLDLGPDTGTFQEGTYQADDLQTARNDSHAEAVQRATDLGLPTSNERDRYGKLLLNSLGESYVDSNNTSLANTNINTRIYGAPKQLAYEYSKAIKADKKNGVRSLYDVEQDYYKRLDPLYAEAKGKKGKEAQAIYDQISQIQEEYMTKEFDQRVKPLLDKYGPEALMNNKQIFKEISGSIMVPGDFTPFFSKTKTPYLEKDVEAYLLDRYGVGKLNQGALPTDAQAQKIITRVNADLSSGRTSSAKFKLDGLQKDIDNGKVYVDTKTMDIIKQYVSAANKR